MGNETKITLCPEDLRHFSRGEKAYVCITTSYTGSHEIVRGKLIDMIKRSSNFCFFRTENNRQVIKKDSLDDSDIDSILLNIHPKTAMK